MSISTPPVITTSDGRFEYAMTDEDILVLARSIRKESMADRQALAWCYAQRYVMFRTQTSYTGSFASMVTYHSQPINPKWMPDGVYCKPGGQYYGTSSCGAAAERRVENARVPWSEIEPVLKDFLGEWSKGHVPNNVPRCVDFRARDSVTDSIRAGTSSRDLVYVETPTQNAFFATSKSEQWPNDGYVMIKPRAGIAWLYSLTVAAVLGIFVGTTTLSSKR